MQHSRWTGFLVLAVILSVSPDVGAALNARDDGKTITLENDRLRLVFDKGAKGNLSAIVDKQSGQNFLLASAVARQLYSIASAGEDGKEQQLNNNAAADVRFQLQQTPGEVRLVETFSNHAGRQLTATVSVTLRADSPLSFWRIEVQNGAQLLLKSVTFPALDAPLRLGAEGKGDAIALPVCDGYLIEEPAKTMPTRGWGSSRADNYPGGMSAQLMTYYGERAGLYLATHDAAGHPKRFGVARRENDLLLSYTHLFPQEKGKGWAMPYDFALGTFQGDWHDAADIYKQWAVKQFWCARIIPQRDDIPAWIKQAPVFHTVLVRGRDRQKRPINDAPNLPAHIHRFAEGLNSPQCAVLLDWEKNGPWVAPHYFPPVGGADLFRKTTGEIQAQGNQTMVYLSGLKWTLKKHFKEVIGYDDTARFEKEGARWAVAGPDGKPAIIGKPDQAVGQGLSADLCQGTAYTKDLLTKAALECVTLGVTSVQLDQIVGFGTRPCYSKEHGHPVGYGVWQYEHLRDLFARVRSECRKKNPQFALSLEEPAELAIPLLDIYDAREFKQASWPRAVGVRGVPIFTYLYHEFAPGFGGEPSVGPGHANAMDHAMNIVCGKTPGMAMWGGLFGPDEFHPNQLRMLKAHINLLHGPARDYLLLGRMIHPLRFDAPRMTVTIGDAHKHTSSPFELSTVLHSGWALPNGNRGYVFVNISQSDVAVNCEPSFKFTLKPQEVRFVEIPANQR